MSEGVFSELTGYHNRRSIRLRRYDYSQPGYYFTTICSQDHDRKLFGDVIDGKIILNDAGECARRYWLEIPEHFPNVFHSKRGQEIFMIKIK